MFWNSKQVARNITWCNTAFNPTYQSCCCCCFLFASLFVFLVVSLFVSPKRQCLDARQPDTDLFDGKACSNVLEVLDICLELPSDSEKYFRFVIVKFSELVHTIKSLCSGNSHRISTEILQTNLPGVFEICSELPSDSRNQFGFVVDEFPVLSILQYRLLDRHYSDLSLML